MEELWVFGFFSLSTFFRLENDVALRSAVKQLSWCVVDVSPFFCCCCSCCCVYFFPIRLFVTFEHSFAQSPIFYDLICVSVFVSITIFSVHFKCLHCDLTKQIEIEVCVHADNNLLTCASFFLLLLPFVFFGIFSFIPDFQYILVRFIHIKS